MTEPTATEAVISTPLTEDTHGLALMLGMSASWIEKRVAARDWVTGRIPVPIDIAADCRLWLYSAVVRGVLPEGRMDLAGDVALEAADDLALGPKASGVALHVEPGAFAQRRRTTTSMWSARLA